MQKFNSEPRISIIILTDYSFNKKFIKCLKTYTNQKYTNYDIILVFFNKKRSINILEKLKFLDINPKRIKFIELYENPGYAKGNNIGVKASKSKYVLISNPDVEGDENLLKKLMQSFQYLAKYNNSDKIIIGPRICNYNGIIEYSRRKINFLGFSNIDISKTNKIRRTMISSGCAFLIKKKYFQELNGFDESYFMYKEDIDFSIRAALFGMKQYINNSIHLYHLRSDEEYKLNPFKYYFHERNRIIMTIQHTSKKMKLLLIHLLFEPLHIIFTIKNHFLKERIKIYKYLIQNLKNLITEKQKENNYFDRYYEMNGIFNEIDVNSIAFHLLNFFSKILFYFYHH